MAFAGFVRKVAISHATMASSSQAKVGLLSRETQMGAWLLESFNGIDSIRLQSVPIPTLERPDDVLVKVSAASINPLDLLMTKGFGNEIFKAYRKFNYGRVFDLPLTLGRDFSGSVVDVGLNGTFNVGDEVWGTVYPAAQGSHADYVLVPQTQLSFKPQNLNHVESASIPYVALTVWGALSGTAKLGPQLKGNPKVLVVGASGGIGTFAVQLLTIWNCKVVAICKDNAFELVSGLGANVVLDYEAQEFESQMDQLIGNFDVVLDCTGNNANRYKRYLKSWACSKYVTLNGSPLPSVDKYGLALGALDALGQLAAERLNLAISGGRSSGWGFYQPDEKALKTTAKFVEEGKIRAVIQRVYRKGEMLAAYQELAKGGARGKIVIDFES